MAATFFVTWGIVGVVLPWAKQAIQQRASHRIGQAADRESGTSMPSQAAVGFRSDGGCIAPVTQRLACCKDDQEPSLDLSQS